MSMEPSADDSPTDDQWYDPETGAGDRGAVAEMETDAAQTVEVEGPGEGIGTGLTLPADRVRLLNYAAELEANDWKPRERAFSARVWAQVSLPYRDPGQVPFWVRKNGDVTLRVRPASVTDRQGNDKVAYPFGILPRHIMMWMSTEATRTKNRELVLGSSMAQFMEKIQIEKGGNSRARVRAQMERVFGSQLSVEGLARGAEGEGYGQAKRYFQIADATQLWFSENEELEAEGLWSSKIILSDPFYQSIVDSPIPTDPAALRAFGTKAMTFDIYVWVAYRLYSLEHPTRMAWKDLHIQFGSQHKRLRDFRSAFADSLRDIAILMPKLKYEVEAEYLLLYPGPTPIESLNKRQMVRSGRRIPRPVSPPS